MYISDTQLKTFLSDAGLVSQKEFDIAEKEAKETNKSVGDILTAHNNIGEDELRRTYAYILGIPFVSLIGTTIDFATLSLSDLLCPWEWIPSSLGSGAQRTTDRQPSLQRQGRRSEESTQ